MKTARRILIFLCTTTLLQATCSAEQTQPNILFITADDMSWDSLGVYGCPVADTTPNLDRLASQSIRFDHAYVQIALCTPSRQVMLSGNYSHQTMTRGFTNLERIGPALPDLLKEHGYYLAILNKVQGVYEWDRVIQEDRTARGRNVPIQGKLVAEIISDSGDKPWFIMMNFNDPHRPFYNSAAEHASDKYTVLREKNLLSTPGKVFSPDKISVPGFLPDLPAVRTEMAQYYSSVRRADDGVGAVLQALKESGEDENTIVLFMSDHGISMPYSKLNCYLNSLRVPLLIRYPDRIEPGSRNTQDLVSAVDLAPTLLELVGIDVPSHMAGRSFVPLLEGQTQEGRDYTVGYYYRNLRATEMYPEFTIQTKDWVYIYNPWVDGKKQVHNADYTGSITLEAIWDAAEKSPSIRKRSDFHKYRVREELYNVRIDPYEYNNLANEEEFQRRVQEMRALLIQWMKETGHPALELMKDPYNEELIASYMAKEKEIAIDQLKEKLHKK